MSRYDFLIESYDTERLKTLSVWSQVPEGRMTFRPEPRARSPLEHMVHQCVSEDTWMRTMLGISVSRAALPSEETKPAFLAHYAGVSAERLTQLEAQPDAWFEAETAFFDVTRSKAWVLARRLTHSAHHRGQLTVYLRLWGQALYSTYGPTADTGGLFQHKAPVIYRYESVDDLLAGEARGGSHPPLPGPGVHSPTERPDRSS
ncbi:MAG TPA: DinB family protein [Vicinamibacterales bacterium]|nr:DinB family protein [Vicinamibacterales bacterium]